MEKNFFFINIEPKLNNSLLVDYHLLIFEVVFQPMTDAKHSFEFY
jgi:hypothetical protein